MKGVARDNNASTECRSNNLDYLVQVRRILCVCVCVCVERKERKKEKGKWMGGNRNKKNEGREIWREKIKKLLGKGGILERDLPEGIRFLGHSRGEIASVPLKIIMDTRAPSLMTIYLGGIKGS